MKLSFLILIIIVLYSYTFNMVIYFFNFDFSSYLGLPFLPYNIFLFLYVFELEKKIYFMNPN